MPFNKNIPTPTPGTTTAVSRKTTPAGIGPVLVRGSATAIPPGQAERLRHASPFHNGYVESLWPATLLSREEDDHSATVTSPGGQESVVALPCLHWADSDGMCRFMCSEFQRAWPNLTVDGEA